MRSALQAGAHGSQSPTPVQTQVDDSSCKTMATATLWLFRASGEFNQATNESSWMIWPRDRGSPSAYEKGSHPIL